MSRLSFRLSAASRFSRVWFLMCIAIIVELPAPAWAVTYPQIDNFQDGTTQGWTNGHGSGAVSDVASGGPGGAGDEFLQVSSGSFGDRPRPTVFNELQWSGDYNAAAISSISMDLKYIGEGNPEGDIEPIRIALFNRLADYAYVSKDGVPGGAFMLPNDGAWHHYVFSLSASALMAAQDGLAPPSLSTVLSSVPQLRIISAAAPNIEADPINIQLGIDNVTAVPEPASLIVAMMALVTVAIFPRA